MKAGTAFATMCLLGIATSVSGWAEPSVPKDLKLFYQQNCSGCHGADGSAVDAHGKRLKGEDLTDAKWLAKTSDQEMVKVILNGLFFGWAMPAYKDKLSTDEAQRLVAEVIRKSKKGQVIAPEVPVQSSIK